MMTSRICGMMMVGVCLSTAGVDVGAQGTPYKLGTFAQGERTFIGLVLDDTLVLDLAQANQAFEKEKPSGAKVAIRGDMKALLAAYDSCGVR